MVLSLGELILRLATSNDKKLEQASALQMTYGGSEANVLIGLRLMGIQARLLSKVPDSPLGIAAIRELSSFEVDTTAIHLGGDRMGIYYMEHGQSLRAGKIIYDRKNASFNTLKVKDVEWDSLFQGVTWVHWSGITPALSANAAALCQAVVDQATSRRLPVSCDLHFRSTLWDYGKSSESVILPLLEKTTYLVGDPSTIARMTGQKVQEEFMEEDQIFESFRNVMDQYPGIQSISMLSRKIESASDNTLKGLLYNGTGNSSEEFHVSPIVDRIGGGDAFMAGLIHSFIQQSSAEEAITTAVAMAAYKHTIPGDHLVGTMDDFHSVISASSRGKLNR
jgi:2-dehydro-3-deoxygluconokinase